MLRIILLIGAVAAFANSFEVSRKFLNFEREKNGNSTRPQTCCLPKQYSALLIQLDALPIKVEMAMQVDYNLKMQVMFNYTSQSKDPQNKVLIDYGKKMLYSVATDDPGNCYKIPFTMPQVQCIPDDAVYLGSSYVGPEGKDALMYNAWQFNLNEYTIVITTTQRGCVPVTESISYPGGKQLLQFAGYQPRLTDPSAFSLPPSCRK